MRPILNKWHPESDKPTYWFPAVFSIGLLISFAFLLIGFSTFLYIYFGYFVVVFIDASVQNKSVLIGLYTLWAALVQFFGYGFGFCRSTYYIRILKANPQKRFPKLFFKNAG